MAVHETTAGAWLGGLRPCQLFRKRAFSLRGFNQADRAEDGGLAQVVVSKTAKTKSVTRKQKETMNVSDSSYSFLF